MTEPKRHDTPHESLYAGMDNAALIAYCREVTRAMKANGYGGLVWDELVERFELALKSISVVSETKAHTDNLRALLNGLECKDVEALMRAGTLPQTFRVMGERIARLAKAGAELDKGVHWP